MNRTYHEPDQQQRDSVNAHCDPDYQNYAL